MPDPRHIPAIRQLSDAGEPAPSSPMYWRLAGVASMLGIDPSTLLADCMAGRVPIRVARFGARQLPYLHSGDSLAFVQSLADTKESP